MSLFSLTNLQWSGSNKADVMSVVDDITTTGSMWENFSYPTDQMFSFCPSLVGPVSSKSPTMSSCLTFRASHQIFFHNLPSGSSLCISRSCPRPKSFGWSLSPKKIKNKTKQNSMARLYLWYTLYLYTH